mmetsp:Transcript_96641/g.242425  ORF Transcript_96641/g.242425 Transcript_96641/m.242425 type:complete len:112 (+) Transcript_96641:135-470(+)
MARAAAARRPAAAALLLAAAVFAASQALLAFVASPLPAPLRASGAESGQDEGLALGKDLVFEDGSLSVRARAQRRSGYKAILTKATRKWKKICQERALKAAGKGNAKPGKR